ncbi:MAG: hypothetical protein OEO79_13265 [Gemmatimonadota bacterium]|nr:hypothetical protein [Gemmatimonadota bacterium]
MRRIRTYVHKGPVAACLAATLVAVVACQERLPTALDDGQLPNEPLTVEVELPWSAFGSNLQVFGGYGSVSALGLPVVAHTFGGTLESRLLLRFGPYTTRVFAVEAGGSTVPDEDITYVGGRLVLTFDTLASVVPGPVQLELGALQEEWHSLTASWTNAVDSVADQRAWSEPGAGPIVPMSTIIWDPITGDTVSFQLDSTDVARWMDASDETRGGRVETITDGVRLQLTRAVLRISVRPSVDPDTLVEDTTTALLAKTFIYDPPPAAPTGVRIGGAPAWRTVMDVGIQPLTGPPELCTAVGGCPYTPQASDVSYAALSLTSQATEAAFRPTDSVRVDLRPVLSPLRLPKSPLGASQTGGFGTPIAAEAFGSGAGTRVEVPMTSFVRTLLSGAGAGGVAPPSTLALLGAPEPSSLTFGSFFGPADPDAPILRLILTVGTPQVLP